MRVRLALSDGRELTYGGRFRYATFRLTSTGGFSVKSTNSASEAIAWTKAAWERNGFKYLVVDTVAGESIGSYPTMEVEIEVA